MILLRPPAKTLQADALGRPPLRHAFVADRRLPVHRRGVKQRTEAAPKVGVDKLPGPGPPVGAFPVKELVVGGVVAVEVAEVPGQQGRRPEVVDVNEGVGRGGSAVVLPTSAHYHGYNRERIGVVAEAVDEELFGDVYRRRKKVCKRSF